MISKNIFKMLAGLMLTFFLTTNLQASEYKKETKKIGNTEITYSVKDTDRIINTVFGLKDEQKIEVLYFFSYNCNTCYIFQDYFFEVQKVILKNKKIKLKKIPLYKEENDLNGISAKVFFLRSILGFNTEFDNIIFSLIHEQSVAIKNQEDLNALFIKYGKINEEMLKDEMVNKKLKYRMLRTKEITSDLKIDSTPTIIVHKDGKRYMINASDSGSPEKMMLALLYLISQ